MYKNKTFTKIIDAYTSEGSGIARIDGYAVFIPGAIAGDTVSFLVIKENKTYGIGKLLEIIAPSPDRIESPCPSFPKCGGCSLMSTSYGAQKEFKRKKAEDALRRIGGFKDVSVGAVHCGEPYKYRNKAQFPVMLDGNKINIGFFAPHSHRVVPNGSCPLLDERINAVANEICSWCDSNGIPVYNEASHSGLLRHICVRAGKEEIGVAIVVKKHIKNIESLAALLAGKFPQITSVAENINNEKTNVIYGEHDRILFGNPYITDSIGNIKYQIHYKSFYQVNRFTTELLYMRALELSGANKTKTVFDLYCGIGTISLFAAQMAKSVVGIEIVPEAIENAKENAKLNGINNAEFFCGKAEEIAPKLISDGYTADIVFLDPPRKGCESSLLECVANMNPEKIVYVSCDPATLARDAKILCEYGYELKIAEAVDQFPNTYHVETIALIQRRDT